MLGKLVTALNTYAWGTWYCGRKTQASKGLLQLGEKILLIPQVWPLLSLPKEFIGDPAKSPIFLILTTLYRQPRPMV